VNYETLTSEIEEACFLGVSMSKKYKLTNEYLSIAHMVASNEPYNPSLDIVNEAYQRFFSETFKDSIDIRGDIDYVLTCLMTKPQKETGFFDRLWETFIDVSKLKVLTYKDFKPLFYDFGELQISASPRDVVLTYRKVYRRLLKYIRRTYKCEAKKTDVGLIYDLDKDITQELDTFVIYNTFGERGARHDLYHQLRELRQTLQHQNLDLRTLQLTKKDIDFDLLYRRLESQIIDVLKRWNEITCNDKDNLRQLSKHTRKDILKLFYDSADFSSKRQDKLWHKIVDLINRRKLYPSYELFQVFIGVLDRFKDKRLVEKRRKELELKSMANVVGIPTLDDFANRAHTKSGIPRVS